PNTMTSTKASTAGSEPRGEGGEGLVLPRGAVGLEDVDVVGAEVVARRVAQLRVHLRGDPLLLLEHPHEVLPGQLGAAEGLLVALEGLVGHGGQAPEGEGQVVGGGAQLLA